MNAIVIFLAQLVITFFIVSLIAGYLHPHLRRVLVDLCGTEDRAQFWTVFSNILLIGFPSIFALKYKPEAQSMDLLFFEITAKLGGNLGGLLFALISIGVIVSFFALVAPKHQKAEAK